MYVPDVWWMKGFSCVVRSLMMTWFWSKLRLFPSSRFLCASPCTTLASAHGSVKSVWIIINTVLGLCVCVCVRVLQAGLWHIQLIVGADREQTGSSGAAPLILPALYLHHSFSPSSLTSVVVVSRRSCSSFVTAVWAETPLPPLLIERSMRWRHTEPLK